jgi:hypothetical protein
MFAFRNQCMVLFSLPVCLPIPAPCRLGLVHAHGRCMAPKSVSDLLANHNLSLPIQAVDAGQMVLVIAVHSGALSVCLFSQVVGSARLDLGS